MGKDGGRVVLRGRLSFTGDGGAVLEVAGTHILLDEKDAQAATAALVRRGKVFEPVGAIVIPAQRDGVLFTVGGRDGRPARSQPASRPGT
ncbi:hypothetical protein ACIODT_38465 [Streptomyces sp. NPDC088251]|uniref:hypothetical protein n=1 Tax=Streptomyces sp. NPDC088251 TaxID=3365844 RepID=UPI003827FE6F